MEGADTTPIKIAKKQVSASSNPLDDVMEYHCGTKRTRFDPDFGLSFFDTTTKELVIMSETELRRYCRDSSTSETKAVRYVVTSKGYFG